MLSGLSTFSYHPNGKVSQLLQFAWNDSPSSFQNEGKFDFTYNTNGDTLSFTQYFWSTFSNDWGPGTQIQNVYNGSIKIEKL